MGSRELEQSTKHATSPQDIIKYLDDLFSYALYLGMNYEQYWYGEPSLLLNYIKAEEYRTIKRNNELWLQGLYVYHAIGDLVPILNPFSKDHKPRKYFDKPIPITDKEKVEQENEKIEKMKSYMMSLVDKK